MSVAAYAQPTTGSLLGVTALHAARNHHRESSATDDKYKIFYIVQGGTHMIARHYWLALLVVLLVSSNASYARAATVTISATGACDLDSAIETLNNRANIGPCTHTGTFGSSDQVVLGSGDYYLQEDVDPGVNMTIAGMGQTGSLRSIIHWSASWDGELFYLRATPGRGGITLTLQSLGLWNDSPSQKVAAVAVLGNTTVTDDANLTLDNVGIQDFTSGAVIAIAPGMIWFRNHCYVGDVSNYNTGGWPSPNPWGGAVEVYAWNMNHTTELYIDESTFNFNSSLKKGGAIYDEGNMVSTNSTFGNNTASSGPGGAIYLAAPGYLNTPPHARVANLWGSQFEYNVCYGTRCGGAIFSEGSPASLISAAYGNSWVGNNNDPAGEDDVNWSPYTCSPTHSSTCGQ
jgi:hypothetical protein